VRLYKLAQKVCYGWNWAAHNEMLANHAFQQLLCLPFMSRDKILKDCEANLRVCRTNQYENIAMTAKKLNRAD
jgi:hypothetical protein